MERQKFEEEWKEAFGEAEVSPSENLWTNIELDLEKAEGEKMKRRVLFYKLMAAASIVFAMSVAGVGTYYYKNNVRAGYVAANSAKHNEANVPATAIEKQDSKELQQRTSAISDKDDTDNANDLLLNGEENGDHSKHAESAVVNKLNSNRANEENLISSHKETNEEAYHGNQLSDVDNKNLISSFPTEKENAPAVKDITEKEIRSNAERDEILLAFPKPALNSLLASKKIKLEPRQKEVDPFLAMMAKLDQRELELRGDKKTEKKKTKTKNESLWTSLGFAAGSFSSTNSNVNSFESSLSQPALATAGRSNTYSVDAVKDVASKQSKASGISYSLGLSVGTKISERWIVQGGVNYLTQSSSYETASMTKGDDQNFNVFTLKEAAKVSENDRIKPTAPYNVNNSLQFISVPLQAGYIILKHKVGIQVNTGISTELFLQSTARAVVNDDPKKVKDSGGNDSPYRPVNFSGLVGTEFSYRFSEHYRIALNPGLRYPFGSIYKSEVGVKSIPLTVDVGLKFKYIFH